VGASSYKPSSKTESEVKTLTFANVKLLPQFCAIFSGYCSCFAQDLPASPTYTQLLDWLVKHAVPSEHIQVIMSEFSKA
jgi:hypothetical protein